MAFRCLTLRERQLERNGNRLAILKSAETYRVLIPPNGKVVINTSSDRKIPYQKVLAMLQSTLKSIIPPDLDITPSLHLYDFENSNTIPVEISNITARTVSVPPRAIVCEMQPVTIADTSTPVSTSEFEQILEKVQISDTLTEGEKEKCRGLVSEFQDIFSTNPTDIGSTDNVCHHLELSDSTPF